MDMRFAIWTYRHRDLERDRLAVEANDYKAFVAYQAMRRATGWVADGVGRIMRVTRLLKAAPPAPRGRATVATHCPG